MTNTAALKFSTAQSLAVYYSVDGKGTDILFKKFKQELSVYIGGVTVTKTEESPVKDDYDDDFEVSTESPQKAVMVKQEAQLTTHKEMLGIKDEEP